MLQGLVGVVSLVVVAALLSGAVVLTALFALCFGGGACPV